MLHELPLEARQSARPGRQGPEALLAITLFEEEDNERMGDLVDPASGGPDDQSWTQDQAEALRPEILELIDAELARLAVAAQDPLTRTS